MSAVLGLDTSNYRSSLAAVSPEGEILLNCRELLPVEPGKRGLRQSDALYLHLKQMKAMDGILREALRGRKIAAVAASTAPRSRADSYMPVFEAGETLGRLVAASLGVPFFPTSHQQGHLRAARYGTALERETDFLALHLSGGTTDLLAVRGTEVTPLGSSLDLHVGQLVDRVGVAMGLPFPAGPELERLAELGRSRAMLGCSMADGDLSCHFSGAETKALSWICAGTLSREDTAREVYDLMARTITRMLMAGRRAAGLDKALLCGGVASSALFRGMLEERLSRAGGAPEVCFGDPELSGDNAVGVALIGADEYRKNRGGSHVCSRS